MKKELKLAELAKQAGVPARTIRLYITQGVLPRPLRAGRDAAYGEEHLARLRAIRSLQREGLTLAQIRARLVGEERQESRAPATLWQSQQIAPDVMIMVREDVSPWRRKRIAEALSKLATLINTTQ